MERRGGDGREEETAWKCKRTVKNSNAYVDQDARRRPGNTRAHAQNRARAVRAPAPIGTPGTRANGGTAKIAQQSLGEGYVRFPQLAPIPMSDILRLRLLGRCRMNLCPFSCVHLRA